MSFTKMSSSCAHPSSLPLLTPSSGPHLPCGGYFSGLPAFLATFVIFPTQVEEYRGLETTSERTRDCNFRTHRRYRLLWCLSFRIFSLCLSQFKQTTSFINILQWMSNACLRTESKILAWLLGPYMSCPCRPHLSPLYHALGDSLCSKHFPEVRGRWSGRPRVRDSDSQ